RKLVLQGRGESAVLALYAATMLDPIRLDLWDLPASHRAGPQLLNVLRYTDVPEVVALAAAKFPVTLHLAAEADRAAWAGAARVSGATGGKLTIRVSGG
ncbi:MAG TPA: hypothetical protein VH092_28100, partial [Urbifossiella sp.]|nr:hypothetical protein [Urbifossiella sp.]